MTLTTNPRNTVLELRAFFVTFFFILSLNNCYCCFCVIFSRFSRSAKRGGNLSHMYVCMYVCMVITYSRVWINWVRLPILLVVGKTGKINIPLSPCVPENLVSRDGFSRPVPRQPAHLHTTQAESGAYLRDSSRVPRRHPFMKPPYIRHRVSPVFIGSRNCVPMAFTAESPLAQDQ